MPSDASENDYILAPATEKDLDAIMEIERLCFPAPWARQAFADELARPWARLLVLRHRATDRVRSQPALPAAEPRGRVWAPSQGAHRIVGFCNYWLVADELHILNVAVHPEERRRGHAARLLRHILDEGRQGKARVASLEVRAGNHAAAALYRTYGFREVGRRPKYYADNGEDALLMDLELST